jgi:hypothetical protein
MRQQRNIMRRNRLNGLVLTAAAGLSLLVLPFHAESRGGQRADEATTEKPVARFDQVPGLPRSAPEEQGVSSAGVLGFVEAADKDIDSLHSFMLVRHGHVVAEGWWVPRVR